MTPSQRSFPSPSMLGLLLLLTTQGPRLEAAAPAASASRPTPAPVAAATSASAAASTALSTGAAARCTGLGRARLETVGQREVCAVAGRLVRGETFRLLLPLQEWKGVFSQLSCTGACAVPAVTLCEAVVRRGHACVVATGHAAGPAREDAAHELADAAKALVARFYGQPSRRNLFLGCSGGGQEALLEAQRHPQDFNGILAGAPPVEPAVRARAFDWNLAAVRGTGGHTVLTREDLERLHRAAVRRCDADDGLVDGLIGDPLRCRFDPAELACDRAGAGQCLSAPAIAAAARLYAGPPVATAAGSSTMAAAAPAMATPAVLAQHRPPGSAGLLPGSEPGWTAWLDPRDPLAGSLRAPGSPLRAQPAAADPDLSAFAAAGGKLILYHGLADPLLSPLPTIQYFETLARTMHGLVQAQSVVRFFAVPGMGHCGGGDGAARIDWLSALETWAGAGSARPPDDVLGYRLRPGIAPQPPDPFSPAALDGAQALYAGWMVGGAAPLEQAREMSATQLSRPVFAYPLPTRYKGRGDPAHWMNFYAPDDYSLQFE
ncbi:MAG: tannase/feruloyl esterase family alpha/beta hydrolase [Steroidobacteraceae bacterium]